MDGLSGRKLINQYEVIDEIGRGVHGKVKLARSLETGEFVAIKIIQRFSKKRRLGRVTVSPEDKTKREIAILKKIRHANVVGLLEVIDDPELKKIYMVLEHVELGEIIWRKKGNPQICQYERRRIERDQRGEKTTAEDEKLFQLNERRRRQKESKRAKISQLQLQQGHADYWSLEHGEDEDGMEGSSLSRQTTHDSTQNLSQSYRSATRSIPSSASHSRATSRAPSKTSSRAHTPLPEHDIPALDSDNEDDVPGPLPIISSSALEGTYYGSYPDEPHHRGRSPSMADSIISHMSSVDDIQHDAFEDDFSYVPCFTIDQARSAFRDTVLGLEYLHYEGIVHRDIKPANLLWTRDHRVKISDFGVSYFGRPIREGETEENISEADATDFDDDLELAKTVGTPAFFAPELCYTDLDVEQPKVTEQIDVWSLGITLYCLIFARIPFLADDEYQLFKAIAKNDVYIPKKRLKAVDPEKTVVHSTIANPQTGPSTGPYREDAELAFENIDDELHDLIRRMLLKDPQERMKLREVKRHPWVIKGIDNIMGWIDDTDPSRRTSGRRIQVDRAELEHAVVPITMMDRARSVVKKVIGKVSSTISTRVDGSRKRATSNATSSGADNPQSFAPHTPQTPITPYYLDRRRTSLRGDESYFTSVSDLHEYREPTEHHPLAQSLTASPDLSADDDRDPFSLNTYQQSASVGATPKRAGPSPAAGSDSRPGLPDRTVSAAASIQTVVHRGHSYSRSVASIAPSLAPSHIQEESPSTPGPFTDHQGNILGGHLWDRGRDFMAEIGGGSADRARSVDHGIFATEHKHADSVVAMSDAVAEGHFESPRPSRSAEISPTSTQFDKPLPSPLFFQSHMIHQHQFGHFSSAPNVAQQVYAASNLDQRPATANRTPESRVNTPFFVGDTTPEPKSPALRVPRASTPETFAHAEEILNRRAIKEAEEENKRKSLAISKEVPSACPPSPDDEIFMKRPASHHSEGYVEVQEPGAPSSSSVSNSTLASPSDVTSPISSATLGSSEQFFPSVPSLPALVSSGSSVCADPEGEFLQYPGVVSQPQTVLSTESTPETISPPLLSKQSSNEGPTETEIANMDLVDEEGYNGDGDTLTIDDDDSDSDEGLTMTRRKPTTSAPLPLARRGTNNSARSTDTAKKVTME